MHLTMSDEMHAYNLEEYETTTFEPIVKESVKLNQEITTIFKATGDIETDIADIAKEGQYDLVLVGVGKSIYEGTLLGKVLGFTSRIINPDRLLDKFTGKEGLFENSPFDERTRLLISKTKEPLGILIDKDLQKIKNVLIGMYSIGDVFLIDYAQKLMYNNDSHVTILDNNEHTKNNFIIQNSLVALEEKHTDNFDVFQPNQINKPFLLQQNLAVFSLETWKKLIEDEVSWLADIPSVLIIKP
jgi:hypothetical protein